MAPHPTIPISKIKNSPASSLLTPEIRSALLTALMTSSAIPKIHTTLLSSCESTGWLDALRERALQLLRSGECTSYRDLMAVLKEETRVLPLPRQGDEGGGSGQAEEEDNEFSERRRMRRNRMRSGDDVGEEESEIDVRIPAKVYNDGVRAVRTALEAVVEVVD